MTAWERPRTDPRPEPEPSPPPPPEGPYAARTLPDLPSYEQSQLQAAWGICWGKPVHRQSAGDPPTYSDAQRFGASGEGVKDGVGTGKQDDGEDKSCDEEKDERGENGDDNRSGK
ncbi:MAG: hypothetical protein HETSPECPRED_003853 [Heterodermia speciosa]|uniref:Uncharacterized protein n=1 Tax=Heterodermia speciosa TaxID=116794 RepID=A0A8H3J723_9LECA|nr:MAG: hypothetical protein HETSPECPRED_003853 [Heterodermia speciosa]